MEKTPTFQVQAFGNYYLLERIAVGGMAEIFKAKQFGVRGFEKILVIKKILHHLSEDPEFVEMFEDEAKIAAQLNQANIVQIYELGEVDGTLYITMEYVEGKNLRDITRSCSQQGFNLSVEQSIFFMIEVLRGLDYAHRKTDSDGQPLAIIHRDISPQNIIVSYEGEVKILDFGIAKAASKISKTEAGVLKGKFSYMSPEQASGRSITQTSDIYACGVMLHELLTSDRLFRAKTDMETLERVKEGYVPAPSEKNPKVPKELDAIVLKALQKNQANRYQTANEFLSDLTKFSQKVGFRYSTQELSAFMKTLFSSTIDEERERLKQTLGKIPSNAQELLTDIDTHISFKRLPTNAAGAQTSTEENPDETFTVSKQVSPWKSAKARRLSFFALGLIGLAIVGFLIVAKNPEQPEQPAEISKQTPAEVSIAPILQPTIKPSPSKESIGDVLSTVKLPQPELEEETPTLAPTPKKVKAKPSATATPEPAAVGPGTIDIIAPPEGFARVFIDGNEWGIVPGPKARGISIESGTHKIRCEAAKKTYEGSVEVAAESRLTIRCEELR